MFADIVVVGACNTDLSSYTPRLPKGGETIHGTSFSTGCGGKGGNQCIQAAKLGAKTAMVAKVGNDSFGHIHCQTFDTHNVNRDYVKTVPDVSTGTAAIIVDEQGENCIVIVSGANLYLTPKDVIEAEELIKNCKVLVCQGEILEETTKQALIIGKKYGVKTLMNAAPANAKMDEEIYGLSTIFCVNETEAEILTGICISNVKDAEKAAKIMLDKGSCNVIITLGSKGALLATKTVFTDIPAQKVSSVVDTTGAGDAFVGALAFFISSKPELSLEQMVKKSCEIASYSVQYKGTQISFATFENLKEFKLGKK